MLINRLHLYYKNFMNDQRCVFHGVMIGYHWYHSNQLWQTRPLVAREKCSLCMQSLVNRCTLIDGGNQGQEDVLQSFVLCLMLSCCLLVAPLSSVLFFYMAWHGVEMAVKLLSAFEMLLVIFGWLKLSQNDFGI